MKAFCSRWFGTFLFLLITLSIGRSADRVGLIFGNVNDERAGILDDADNDARLLAETSENGGFEVGLVLDAALETMEQEVADFHLREETANIQQPGINISLYDSFVVTQDPSVGSLMRPALMAQTSPERTASPVPAPPQGASPAALPQAAPEGRRVVLSVGVDDPKKEGFPKLTAADSDAEKIAEAFRNSGSNDDRIVAMTSVSSHDASEGYSAPLYPSTENIRTMMEAEFSELRPQDIAVFSFAGYEVQREGDDDFYFMTGGGDNGDPATLISLSEVYQAILDSGAGSGLVLIDACRHNETSTPLSPPPGIAVFFSCSQGEFAIESADAGSPSGLFTETFVSAMEGAADFDGNGKVEWEELTEHVIREVARRASLLETPASQVPELFGSPRRSPAFAAPAAEQ